MRIALLIAAALAACGLIWGSGLLELAAQHAASLQREYQNAIGEAVHAIRQEEPDALLALVSVCLAYGFFHAVGPGHGKYVVGGLGFSSSAGVRKFVLLSLAASLAQAAAALILVYGGFIVLGLSSRLLLTTAEQFLAPASQLAIGAIGAWLAYQAARTLWRRAAAHDGGHAHATHAHHAHAHHECCGHAHGPTIEEADAVRTWRQAAVIIGSIAMRPCTGAVLLLIVSWRMEAYWAGVLGVLAMGIGTGALLSAVAASSVVARRFALWQAHMPEGGAIVLFAGIRFIAGASILAIAAYLFMSTASQPAMPRF